MTQRCAGRQGYREPECAFLKLQGPSGPEASAGDAPGTPRGGEPAGSLGPPPPPPRERATPPPPSY